MTIEIEKKYRLTNEQRRVVEKKLRALGFEAAPIEFEENTLYGGGDLAPGSRALRLRRVNDRAKLTHKRRLPSKSAIKHQEENETAIANPDAMDAILIALGFRPRMVYEKRRTRWSVGKAILAIDELPFGLFMEIEASEKEIRRVEKLVGLESFAAVHDTYPSLTAKFGKKKKGIIEARF